MALPKATSDSVLCETMACTNCDDPVPKIAVWCMECFALEKTGSSTPVALCKQCNIGLHTPAKLSLHRRQPFRCNTDRMRTHSELKLSAPLAASFPALCSLMCSNCEALLDYHLEAQWCSECALILCKDCSRDLHAPQKKKVHHRYPFHFRFISAAHLDDENGTIEEAATHSRQVSSVAVSFSGSSSPTGAAISSALNARATMPAPGAFKIAAGTVARKAGFIRAMSSATDDANTNRGIPGDVMQISEPALTGAIECTLHLFKNTFNDFDTIGSVQIVQIACGNKHAGAVTAGGSLFMWGQNSSSECGMPTGEEKDIKEPTIVQLPGNKRVRMIACGHEHSAAITMDNAAYSWGSGLMGILGHASDVNRETPTEINLHWNAQTQADPKEKLVWVACGQHNTGIVCQGRADRRQMYTFGGGEYGTLGTGNKIPSLQPQLIHVEEEQLADNNPERFPQIEKMCFGTNHTVAVATNGSCYTFGSNSCGQLGYYLDGQDGTSSSSSSAPSIGGGAKRSSSAQSGELQLRPRLVDSLRAQGIKVTHAACSELSTSVLTSTGAVYSWGSGETHCLGVMDNVDQFLPVKAAVLGGDNAELKAVSLAVGVSSCAAVTESGDVFMWGWSVEAPIPTIVSHLRSNHMQAVAIGAHDNVVCLTGVSNEIYEWRFSEEFDHAAEPEPKQNRALRGKRLVSISVGKGRCAAATAAGVLLEWGVDTRDPDAPDDEEFDAYRPREIRCLWTIAEVKCSAEHSVALTTDGKCLTWGLGMMGSGRLGHPGGDRDIKSPTLVEALKDQYCTSIAIGPMNTGVTTKNFKAFVWGAGNSGQLGNNDIHPVFAPGQIAALQHVEVVGMAFGNRHLVIVSKDGAVWATGDNSFGQCGQPPTDAGDSKFLRPVCVSSLAAIAMAEVACGDNVTLVLSRDGRLFAFGAGETQQIPGHAEDVHTPVQIQMPFASEQVPIKGRSIKEISVANINCAALADNGSVWTWGFALGEAITRVDYFVQEGFSVQKVAMGPNSMLLSV